MCILIYEGVVKLVRMICFLINIEVLCVKVLEKDLMLYDGDGFFLFVKMNGKKLWCFCY